MFKGDCRSGGELDQKSEKYISYFRAPKLIFIDNEGEFQNEEMCVLTERFDIEMKVTPNESPWNNGICEG